MADSRVFIRLVLAAVLLAGVVIVLGPERMLTALSRVAPVPYAIAVGAQVLALTLWGVSLAVLLRTVEDAPTGLVFVGGYCTGLLLRFLVPWGRSGGAVFTAFALSETSRARFEGLLATAFAADLLKFLISLLFVFGGVTLLSGSVIAVGVGPVTAVIAVGFFVVSLAVFVISAPGLVTRAIVGIGSVLGRTIGRLSPTIGAALDPPSIRDRTHRFFGTVQTLTRHHRILLVATTFAALGWVAALAPLYFTVTAAGATVTWPMVMFIVPAAGLAGIAPLPGGTGGIEVALVGLLVIIAGIDVALAGVVTVLYRLATFWLGLGLAAVGAVLLTPDPFPLVEGNH